jgi:ABC-type multidrug transport system fused ATPase/permease subunit
MEFLSFPFTIVNSLLPIVLKLLGLSIGDSLTSFLFNTDPGSPMAGFAGLGLSLALGIASQLGSIVWVIGGLEGFSCSVDRIHKIVSIDKELESELDITGRDDVNEFEERGLILQNIEICYRAPVPEDFDLRNEKDTSKKANQTTRLPPAIIDFSAEVKPGQHIGVVGRSGSGKSTLFSSLLNLIPLSKGSIRIDGRPLSSFSSDELRAIVGALPQSAFILSGWSIRKALDPEV